MNSCCHSNWNYFCFRFKCSISGHSSYGFSAHSLSQSPRMPLYHLFSLQTPSIISLILTLREFCFLFHRIQAIRRGLPQAPPMLFLHLSSVSRHSALLWPWVNLGELGRLPNSISFISSCLMLKEYTCMLHLRACVPTILLIYLFFTLLVHSSQHANMLLFLSSYKKNMSFSRSHIPIQPPEPFFALLVSISSEQFFVFAASGCSPFIFS